MLDVTQFLYHGIGDRVKAMRKRHNSTQQHFCCYTLDNQINISALSRIENGKNDKHKNPYLLSPSQIEILCEFQSVYADLGQQYRKRGICKVASFGITYE